MRFQPGTFLWYLKNIVTGRNGPVDVNGPDAADGGIQVDKTAPFRSATATLVDSTTGTPSTTFTLVDVTVTPTQALINANFATVARAINSQAVLGTAIPAATNPTIGTTRFVVPRDYDEASDHFYVNVYIADAAADASIELTGTPTVRSLGLAPVVGSAVIATVPFTGAIAAISTVEQIMQVDLSGLSLKRNDIVTVTLALVGTTTGVVTVYATEFQYDSTVASYNETTGTGIASAYKGFPLR